MALRAYIVQSAIGHLQWIGMYCATVLSTHKHRSMFPSFIPNTESTYSDRAQQDAIPSRYMQKAWVAIRRMPDTTGVGCIRGSLTKS